MHPFRIEATSGGGRACRAGSLLTPTALLHTTFGQPSTLTPVFLASLPPVATGGAGVRLGHLLGHEAHAAAAARGSFAAYSHLGARATVLTVRDPWRAPLGEASDASLGLEQWGGRRRVSPSEYAAAARTLGVDAAVTLHDELPPGRGKNRTRAAALRCAAWARACLSAWRSDSSSSSSASASAGAGAAASAPTAAPAPLALAYVTCVPEEELRRDAFIDVLRAAVGLPEERLAPAPAPSSAAAEAAGAAAGAAAAASSAAPSAPAPAAPTPTPTPTPLSFAPLPLAPGVLGFALGGLGLGEGPAQRTAILAHILPQLPTASLRYLPGIGSPADVLRCVSAGVDVFDGDYPGLLARHGYAAGFVVDGWAEDARAPPGDEGFEPLSSVQEGGEEEEAEGEGEGEAGGAAPTGGEGMVKRVTGGARSTARKGFSGTSRGATAVQFGLARAEAALSSDGTKLCLARKAYAEDWRPLVAGCGCFVCSGVGALGAGSLGGATRDGRAIVHPGHHRAYVHHLVHTQEILGTSLLTLHNTYAYAQLFDRLRSAVVEGRLEGYIAWLRRANRWEA
jgi:queuine/archaeosine tRNA-ribosyltransferase